MKFSRTRTQNATYWAVTEGQAGSVIAAPVAIKCRWEEVQIEFVDSEGETKISQAIVYPLSTDTKVGGWLYLGTSVETDPRDVDGAEIIRSFNKSPRLRRPTEFNRMAIL